MTPPQRAGGLPPFVLVTGNPDKQLEAERILGYRPSYEPVDLPEIQSLDIVAVLRAKAEAAWQRLGTAVVVEETGLYLDALNGFPGPLVKWMLEAVGARGIAHAAHRLGDPRATVRCALIYRSGDTEVIAEGETHGHLTPEPRGDGGFGWDPVLVPDGGRQTFAEMPESMKDRIGHRGLAWRHLRQALLCTDLCAKR